MIRAAIGAVVLVAALVVLATVRQTRAGGRAMAESDAALARGDTAAAIAAARAAADARVPGSPFPARGYDRLAAIARDAEAHGDDRTAIAAWGAARAAAIATGGALAERWRRAADEGIARAGSRAWTGGDPHGATEVRASAPALRDALARDDLPASTTLILLAAGAACFFAGALRLLWSARDARALLAQRRSLAVAAAGLVLYGLACLRG